jgi:regulator of sirC expression with transglutaminase-like and TPR domain
VNEPTEKHRSRQTKSLGEWLRAGESAPIERLVLALAEDAYPGLSPARYDRILDDIAQPLIHPRRADAMRPEQQARALSEAMYDRAGFRGNEADYYDPRNSFLNEVIDRRTGIPITLAVVILALCRRAGIPAVGVLFPGHFLVRIGDDGGCMIDPFDRGRVLERPDLERLLQRVTGRVQSVKPRHTAVASPRAIVSRILTNLKGIYAARQDHARVMLTSDRLVDLGGDVSHLRDRGMSALALGAVASARADLERYLDQDPEPADAIEVRQALATAAPGRLH